MNNQPRIMPAEWYPQSAVQLTWPHPDTDWAPYLDEANECFAAIAKAIASRQLLLVVCHDVEQIKPFLRGCPPQNIRIIALPANDTWARDHGAITVLENDKPILLDFKFNGWGLKFPANHDNLITRRLVQQGIFSASTGYENHLNFAFEGGSIESDGQGTILTTTECLLSLNRNGALSQFDIENYLKHSLGAQRILWLHHGYLAGDDTDSHIDTLARLCTPEIITYVKCENPEDEHFAELAKMEKELKAFTTTSGEPYLLVPLPMADAVYDDEQHRLPATYANFLIINGAVLVPFYNSPKDPLAKAILQSVFPDREIIGINCLALIKQHGSLHCVTMQYPEGVII